ncbi:acyl-CoA dehydrogenase family protein [Sinorhizobium sp. BG8]|uniref:acyl-CoA dehydrogenase family protein n=1 Tax=Sinorhizobium sp. BG8 TaxID=2613773 RepID=UPI00193E78F3|nr:acyl-CoA dehydrogenase family protein [Sinorhizobium sp. BG8]QRM57806.1 hypothetical protein F3Y30_25475 [Sinorhizobium sp. BG8]
MTLAFNNNVFPQSPSYEQLANVFRPAFNEVRKGAEKRDAERELPHEAVRQLTSLRFGALRLSTSEGGFGASLTDLFRLLAELAEADSNLVQILRGHFGFVEDLLYQPRTKWSKHWIGRVAAGELVAPGWTEPGSADSSVFSTLVKREGDHSVLQGRKFYTTGALFSEWIDVGATDESGERVSVVVSTRASGVRIEDDWNGFGQSLTASGTAVFDAVHVDPSEIRTTQNRVPYQTAFFQVVHLATLAGIANAAVSSTVQYLDKRQRTYSHATTSLARHDPQVLQLLGRVKAAAYAASTLALDAAQRLDDAAALIRQGVDVDIAALDATVYQAQIVVAEKALEATTTIFGGLGASALSTDLRLDRYWRNARTVASHNPVIYKERIVGDYVLNGVQPPAGWLSGVRREA